MAVVSAVRTRSASMKETGRNLARTLVTDGVGRQRGSRGLEAAVNSDTVSGNPILSSHDR